MEVIGNQMSRNYLFVSATDFGKDNDKYPRWAVFEATHNFLGIYTGMKKRSEYFWTPEETQAELKKMEIERARGGW